MAYQYVADLAKFAPNTAITKQNIASFTLLPDARLQAEHHVAEYLEATLQADIEDINPFVSALDPHHADAPTSLLSAYIRRLNYTAPANPIVPAEAPPDPSSPFAMVG